MDYTQLSLEELTKLIKSKISDFIIKQEKMQESYDYYRNKQDILNKQRLVIDKDGKLKPLNNLPNNKLIDNQFAKVRKIEP